MLLSQRLSTTSLQLIYEKGRNQSLRRAWTAFLMDRTDAYKVRYILDLMEQSGIIKSTVAAGKTAYIPQAKGGER